MKQFLSVLLVLVMVFGILPVGVSAGTAEYLPVGIDDHPFWESEPNDLSSQADRIGHDYTIFGAVTPGDVDHFYFSLSTSAQIQILAVADYRSFMYGVFDSNLEHAILVGSFYSYADSGNASFVLGGHLPAGSYYLVVLDSGMQTDEYAIYTDFGSSTSHTHSYSPSVVAPTCTEQGYTVYTCSCGDRYTDDYVPATGHSYSAEIVPPTCSEAGYTRYTCVCGDSYTGDEVPAQGHLYQDDVCVGCGQGNPYLPVDLWEQEPNDLQEEAMEIGDDYILHGSLTAENWVDRYWFEMTETATVTITAVGLNDALLCTLFNSTSGTSFTSSSVIGSSDDHVYFLLEYELTPDVYQLVVLEKNGLSNEYQVNVDLDGHWHSFTGETTEAICTEDGYTTYTCDCGASYRADPVATEGHKWDEGIVIQEPTEWAEGQIMYTCTVCAEMKIEPIPMLVHIHSYEQTVTPPSCTEQGYTTYTCACGDSYILDFVPATGHGYEEGVCISCGAEDPDYVAPVTNPFTDVQETDYFYQPVLWAVQNGITAGISADRFGPNSACTRAQVVTFLWRANGQPEPSSDHNPFVDVSTGDYFYKPVLWAVEMGITAGISADRFGPNNACTRAQVATFLWRAKGQPVPENTENGFGDVKPGDYFYNAVLWAVENGVTKGLNATTFGAAANCTRGQIVTFLYRADGLEGSPVKPEPPEIPDAPTEPTEPEIPEQPENARDPDDLPAYVTFTGSGDRVITGIDLPSGEYYAEYIYEGSSNFIVWFYYGEGSHDRTCLSNEIGSCTGRHLLEDTINEPVSDGMLDVKSSGSWTIHIKPVSGTTTTNIRGFGSAVTGKFTAATARTVFNLTHDGDSNFIIWVYESGGDSHDRECLINEIGAYSGQTLETLEQGKEYYFFVKADGNWTIDLGEGSEVTVYEQPDGISGSGESTGGNGGDGSGDTVDGVAMYESCPYVPDFGEYFHVEPYKTNVNESYAKYLYSIYEIFPSADGALRDYWALLGEFGFELKFSGSNASCCAHETLDMAVWVNYVEEDGGDYLMVWISGGDYEALH